jgi:hypothetical protein
MSTSQDIVARLWNLCHVLRDDGITYHQYVTDAKSRCCLIRAAKLIHLSSGSMKTVSLCRIPIYAGHRGLFFTNVP